MSFLFIIVMEGLHFAIKEVISHEYLEEQKFKWRVVYFTYILCGRCTTSWCIWHEKCPKFGVGSYSCFLPLFGVKNQYKESESIWCGDGFDFVGGNGDWWYVCYNFFPFKYFGLSFGSNMYRADKWITIINRYEKNIPSGK